MRNTPTTTTVDYFLTYEPEGRMTGEIDEEAAAERHSERDPYVLATSDRVVIFGPHHSHVEIRSLGQEGVRGILSYQRHRETKRYRLSRMQLFGRNGETLAVEVAPWGGMARVTDSRDNRPREQKTPDEWVREIDVSAFGEWEDLLAMPMDPSTWIGLPEGFVLRR
jgi:hypothetical protein